MRTGSLTLALVITGTLLAGCGGGDDKDSAKADASPSPSASARAPLAGPTPNGSASAKPSPTSSPTAKPKADVAIGPETAPVKYAKAYCRAIGDNAQAARKLAAARATLAKPGNKTATELQTSVVDDLDGFRADVLKNVNNLRKAGSPKLKDGKKMAAGIRKAYDYIDLVDKALVELAAVDETEAADWAKAAKLIVDDLQDDINERGAEGLREAPESDEFADAVIASKACPSV